MLIPDPVLFNVFYAYDPQHLSGIDSAIKGPPMQQSFSSEQHTPKL